MKKQVLFLLLAIPFIAWSQGESKQEIGLHMSSINNFGMIYKNGLESGNFWRYRVAALQVNSFSSNPGDNISFNLAFSAGYEKRKDISTKLEFISGPEFQFGLGGSENTSTIFLAFGYVLGVQYNLNADFKIGIEAIPALRYSYSENANNSNSDQFSLSANSQFASLFIVHQF
ncbi:MAG: hypothetical protein NXI09_07765 [Bacteroidetes bacterium]|nr:hypothetical protein [Bacteroidota bacterium]